MKLSRVVPSAPIAGAAVAAFLVAGCSSSSPADSASTSAGPRKQLRQIGQCLDEHGADATALAGVLTGGPVSVTAAQLAGLRTASRSCESALPTAIRQPLTRTVTCLADHGFRLDSTKPLTALFSLDLADAKVRAAVQRCASTLPKRSGG